MQFICIIYHYVTTVLGLQTAIVWDFVTVLNKAYSEVRETQVHAIKGAFLLVHGLVVSEINKYRFPCWLGLVCAA